MSYNLKVIFSAIISAPAVTLLFLVVPITGTFVVSYLFALIAIGTTALTMLIYRKGISNVISRLSYIYLAIIYGIINISFSIVACLIHFPALLTAVIHIIGFAFFAVKLIVLSAGSEYINKLDRLTQEKRKIFQEEKNKYWNK